MFSFASSILSQRAWAKTGALVLALAGLALAEDVSSAPQGERPPEHQPRGTGAAQRFEDMDKDHDGRISRDEWTRNPRAFDRLDANHDGYITRDELRKARQEGRRRIVRRFQEMDSNHDGKISREEWRGNPKMFDRLDANHDGFISPDELKAHRRRMSIPANAGASSGAGSETNVP